MTDDPNAPEDEAREPDAADPDARERAAAEHDSAEHDAAEHEAEDTVADEPPPDEQQAAPHEDSVHEQPTAEQAAQLPPQQPGAAPLAGGAGAPPPKPKRPSRWLRWVALAAALCGIAALSLYFILREPPPEAAPALRARLELAAGEVLVDQGTGAERAVSGTPLRAGASIETKKGARALVRLPDGSKMFLRDGSKVKLDADAVLLEAGEYWLDAPPNDRRALVHTAGDVSVTAADAGLSYRRDGGDATVYVARGMAVVTGKGGRVEVNAGERATVKGGGKPEVGPVAFWDDWTGGMADFDAKKGTMGPGVGTIYGVDDGALHGTRAQPLEISKQAVRAVVRGSLAETTVDQTFFNPGERPVEGWYWFTVPDGASVTGFAVETNGVLVDGEFVEKKEAATKYTRAKSTGHSPAILEWVDARTFRARIYPVPATGNRRVVLRYIEQRPITDSKLSYVYPMGRGEPVRIGEFSLSVDLGSDGKKMKIATLVDARVENGGELVTMRRSGYTPRADFQLEAKVNDEREPLTVARFDAGGDSADYVMASYRPDVDWSKLEQQRGDVVVVVDTSAAGDEASLQLKTRTAEAILRALSDEDRFALVSLDVRPTVLHPKDGLAAASDDEISKALERLAEHSSGGATDLASLFDVSLGRLHGTEQPAIVYVGDGVATSGELTGEQIVEQLRRALSTSRARLFTVGVGAGANHGLLGELARAGGGEHLRVSESEETTARALELAAALKVPTITDFEVDLGAGLDEPFVSAAGKVSRGSEVTVLARTHHDLPDKVKVRGRLAGKPFEKEYSVEKEKGIITAFVPKLWAAEYVRRLLGTATGPGAERGRIVSLGLEYGLMTPHTSILALENEMAYRRMGIERKPSKLRGVKLGALTRDQEYRLAGALAAGPAPVKLFACNKLEPFADEEKAAEPAESPVPSKYGGQGQRAASQATETESAPATAAAAPPATAKEEDTESRADMDEQSDDVPAPSPEPSVAADSKDTTVPQPAKGGSGAMGRRLRRPQANYGTPTAGDEGGEVAGKLGGAGGLLAEKAKRAAPRGYYARNAGDELKRMKPDLGTCSDVASRPLAYRVLIWRKRLRTATSPSEVVQRYAAAQRSCELPDWLSERTFLGMMQKRIQSEVGARLVLQHFSARPDVQKYVAKLMLRRAVDPRMVAAIESVLFGSAVNWATVDRELSEIEDVQERLKKLREFMARAPEDPNGEIRLVELLAESGQPAEAVAHGRRLRDRGLLTPRLAEQLGDVLARAGYEKDAERTYSEIVEFDPESVPSRRLLGDIYLGHGWYEPAYRQYETLTEIAPKDALGWLRLAHAAAGTGRIDEALRLERRVATAQGNPGPDDPRRWARLSSAARLARLLAEPPKDAKGDAKKRAESIKRQIKELGVFSGPATLVVLTWQDLSASVALLHREDDDALSVGETTDAAPVGLYAVLLSTKDAESLEHVARLRTPARKDALALTRHDITWDGKDFVVKLKRVDLPKGEQTVEL